MNIKPILSIVLLLVFFHSANAQEIQSPKFGKGLFNLVGQDSSWTMKIGARVQVSSLALWENEDGKLINPETNILIRRARLKFDGYAFSPRLKYKIEIFQEHQFLQVMPLDIFLMLL